MRPLPGDIARWSARAPWFRRLDALVAWGLAWALVAATLPDLGGGLQATAAGLAVVLLGATPAVRLRWRPISGLVGLWVSRMLAPGHRAWYMRPDAPELVIVTARRGLRLTVAVPGRGAAEGLSLRRTRVLLISADAPARR